jgi:ABC-type Fe3+/spermidine/putrescine transport system ATPase subunit
VADNIAFGLKYRDVPKAQILAKVKRALDMVRLPGVEKKLPSELSGGQQQRIALARAIVIEPDVLLLDEPLSALDANLREEMRSELKIIQREVGITTIFVTHDQEEALSLSDRIVVMNHGLIEQNGTPEEVYRTPASKFVASFLGQSNLISGTIAATQGGKARIALDNGATIEAQAPASAKKGGKVTVIVRAQRLEVGKTASGPNRLTGRIAATSYLGGSAIYAIEAQGLRLQANAIIDSQVFREGDAVDVGFAPSDCVLLGEDDRRLE